MADDWQAGDEGFCITDGRWPGEVHFPELKWPQKGQRVRVDRVVADTDHRCCGKCFLVLVGFGPRAFCSENFRKLRPDNQPATDGATLAADIRRRVEEVVQ